ncbi:MAG: hypothetical protein ACI4SP_01165 [Eubacteriales bacterium]
MNKSVKYFGVTWLVSLILFHLVTFLLPADLGGVKRFSSPVFWVAYAFILVALLVQLGMFYAFCRRTEGEKIFLGIPLVRVACGITPASVILGVVFLVVPVIPAWIGALICACLTAGFVIAGAKAVTAADAVSAVGERVQAKTAFMKQAVLAAQSIVTRAKGDAKPLAVKVYEALKYSDSVSSPALAAVENEIERHLSVFEDAVLSEDAIRTGDEAQELLVLISQRSAQCKALKNS